MPTTRGVRRCDEPHRGDSSRRRAIRACDLHQWVSLPIPAESWVTPDECPYCVDDEQDGKVRYASLVAQGLIVRPS